MKSRSVFLALVLVLVALPLPHSTAAASETITFNDLTNPNRALNGQYPSGVVDWGTNVWYLAGPWEQFTTNSIGFNGAGPTSAPFTFLTPQRLIQVDVYNGGTTQSTVTMSCAGQTTSQAQVAPGQVVTIPTNWSGTCSVVTIASSNGWNTNFDNLVYDNGLSPAITGVQASSVTSSAATVSWMTDRHADSQIEYGLPPSYGSSTPRNSALVTSHSVSLSGLAASTLYHYQVRSADAGGNLTTSGDLTFQTTSSFCDPPIASPVACENSLPGNPASQWDLPSADDGDPSIQGFATDISINRGDTVHFKIRTAATAYTLNIYRMGYYQGLGARKIATVLPSVTLPQNQPACLVNSSVGLVDCGNWAESASWTVPTTAVSGVYFVKLVRTDRGRGSHIFLGVRDHASSRPVLFQTSDPTWQAYNSYGGASLYVDLSLGLAAHRAYKVSYNRPFNTRANIQNLGQRRFVWDAEYPMIRWLEANGYNTSYFSGVDTDRRGNLLQNHRVFMSVGHDEYWSAGQRANVEAARGAGINLAFFSGNQTFWKTRWEPSIDGRNTANRTLVSYKETHANAVIDPADPPTWTGTWRDPRFSPPADGGQPENALAGVIFSVNGPRSDTMSVASSFSNLRFWRNTAVANLAPGASLSLSPGSLGHEWDEDLDNGFRPAGLIRLSATTVSLSSGYLQDYGSTYGSGTGTHSSTMYRHSSGALIFGPGFTRRPSGPDPNHESGTATVDQNMRQATVNLLADMGVQPGTLQAGLVAATASTDTTRPASTISAPTNGASLPRSVAFTIS